MKERSSPASVVFCENGLVVVFDMEGQQIPKLMSNWLKLWAKYMHRKGVNLRDLRVWTSHYDIDFYHDGKSWIPMLHARIPKEGRTP